MIKRRWIFAALPPVSRVDVRLLLLLGCFLLSGLAGLIYETAWTQQFALVFGTSELAVVAVLAAYMAGLAVGASFAARWAGRLRNPLLTYALLEAGIALGAILVPAGLTLASRIQLMLLGGVELAPESASFASALFYLMASFAVLMVPTALMGASLPVLARHAVENDAQIGSRVGWLYAVNTAGAAGGTLLAAYGLLPRFGLGGTVMVAVGVNAAVFLLALMLARTVKRGALQPAPAAAAKPSGPAWILPLMLASGFVSFTYEVLWTRLLSHLLGGTLFAFATMLATFLCGITLGAAAASLAAKTSGWARNGFIVAQLGIALCSLGAFALADYLPAIAGGMEASAGSFANGALLAAATLFPGALFIGASFPFAVRILARSAAEAGAASGRVFAWNTTGAILGATASGFFLLPAFQFAGTMLGAVMAGLLLAMLAAIGPVPRRWLPAAAVAAAIAAVLLWPPASPTRLLRTSPLTGKPIPGQLVFTAVGRSATTLLMAQGSSWRLTTNGLPESSISTKGSRVAGAAIAHWLGLLPQASRPNAESALVIGFGGGRTLEAFAPTVKEVHVVELEPEVIRANRSIADRRAVNPFDDPRLKIHLNDARSALQLSNRRFDAIISQPSHPWTAGASHLFTREFFDLVRARLNPDGVFVQWIGLPFVDDQLLLSLLAGLNEAFDYVELYHPPPGGAVLFLASMEPPMTPASAARGVANGGQLWRQLGIFVGEDVLAARILDPQASRSLSAGAPINRDNHNLLRLKPPGRGLKPLNPRRLMRWLRAHDTVRNIRPENGSLYLLRRLLAVGQTARARRLAAGIREQNLAAIANALIDLTTPKREDAEQALWHALSVDPESDEAFYALVGVHQADTIEGKPPAGLAARLASDPSARAISRGWRLSTSGKTREIRDLEPRLAEIAPTHPLYLNAVRLRVAWRLASGEPARGAEGIELYDPVLALRANPQELLIRARLGLLAKQPDVVVASLFEIAGRIGPPARRNPRQQALARASLGLLDKLAREPPLEPSIAELRPRLGDR